MEDLRIYAATYNVGTEQPEEELTDLLALKPERKNEKLPDFYVLSFQEVKAQPQNMILDTLFEDPWTNACKELLSENYIKIKSIRLQGLLMVVFSQRKHLLHIRQIESEYTRTGLSGMWGNKGAVSIRLAIYGCSLCFVNSHLSAHDNQLKSRVEDYNSIIEDQKFHVAETAKIFFHDYVFWMGDLNFRLLEEYNQSPEEIERDVKAKNFEKLLNFDQLKHVMKRGEAFSEMIEQDPKFPPTFKYEVGTSQYDHKRRPAWCDRILYSVNAKAYENVTLAVQQLSYDWHPGYKLSDHKPVSAEFLAKVPTKPGNQVFSDYYESTVVFDPIASWADEDENKAVYKMSTDVGEEDWIGIFKHNFNSLDDYVAYEYVSKCGNQIQETGERTKKYEAVFSELPNRCKGSRYCLIYFRQTEDKVMCILGISNSFPIIERHSD